MSTVQFDSIMFRKYNRVVTSLLRDINTVSMMGAGHAVAASSGGTVPASGTAGSGVYRKQSRSANDLSPNTSAVVGATGVHRNTI
ncbi:hypothetical protein GJ496_008681 [Pomphorhynchus laevis]|nr:hypothetical protein GJ496_008681 [Pomphorhynchus laevis]